MQVVFRTSSVSFMRKAIFTKNTRAGGSSSKAEALHERQQLQQQNVFHTARDLSEYQHADVRQPDERFRIPNTLRAKL